MNTLSVTTLLNPYYLRMYAGTGDSEDFARFACNALYEGGWSYDAFSNESHNAAVTLDVQWGPPTEHGWNPGYAVCLFRPAGEDFYIMEDQGVIQGPFASAEEAVQWIAKDKGASAITKYTFLNKQWLITFTKEY